MIAQRKPRPELDGIGLDALVAVAVRVRPSHLFLREPARRALWAGLEAEPLSYAQVDQRARRLAALLRLSRLAERSHALILAPQGSEQLIAMLGALRAGLRPMLLPLCASAAELQGWFDTAGPSVAIGTTRCGELEPALMLRDAAARSFNARLVCAFGPGVPDGVVPLDQVIIGTSQLPDVPSSDALLGLEAVTALASDGRREAVSESDIVGGSVDIARVARLSQDARVLSMMTSPSFAALAAGPYLALLSGAEYLPLGLFSLSALWAGLSDGRATCLVAPASIEQPLRAAGIIGHESIASVVLLHRGRPGALTPAGDGPARLVDVISPEDGGLIVRNRD